MKKLLLLLTIMIIDHGAGLAQINKKHRLQKVTGGFILPIMNNRDIKSPVSDFAPTKNVIPSIFLFTPNTYCNLQYSFGEEEFLLRAGFPFKTKRVKDFNTYVHFEKSTSRQNFYSGIGVEKYLLVNENLTLYWFSEYGVTWLYGYKWGRVRIGLRASTQITLWER